MEEINSIIKILVMLAALSMGAVYAQPSNPHLMRLLDLSKPKQKVDSLNEWAWKFRTADAAQALILADTAAKIASKILYDKGLADAYSRLGVIYKNKTSYAQALDYYFKSLKIREEIEDQRGIAGVNNNLGNIYKTQNQLEIALKHFQKAMSIYESLGSKIGMARAYQNIGLVEKHQGKITEAIDHYQRSYELFGESGKKLSQSQVLTNMGAAFLIESLALDKAEEYFLRSLHIKDSLGDIHGAIKNRNNLGQISVLKGNFETGLNDFLTPSLNLAREHDFLDIQAAILQNISAAYDSLDQYDKSSQALKEALKINDSLSQKKIDGPILNRLVYVEKLKEEEARSARFRQNSILITSILILVLLLAILIFYKQKNKLSAEKEQNSRQELHAFVQGQIIQSMKDVQTGEQKERKRVAKELHNRLGNTLAGIHLQLESIRPQMDHLIEPEKKAFMNVIQTISDTSEKLGDIADDMDSHKVLKDGLISAIQHIIDNINTSQKASNKYILKSSIIHHEIPTHLHGDIQVTIYDIAIELINNVLKHANASWMEVQVSKIESNILLTVEDNGVGFNSEKNINQSGYGLPSLKSEILSLGGEFSIESEPLKGTTCMVKLPIEPPKANSHE